MLKANTITSAMVDAFQDDGNYSGFQIERGEFVNVDPTRCPWIGVYRGSTRFDPETLGDGPDYWTAEMVMRIIVQAANFSSGEECEDDLEGYVEQVLDTVVNDTTLSNTIDMVKDISVTYSYIAEDEETIHFQAAIIELTLEVSTS